MSGLLAGIVPPLFTTWRDQLQPASFRGAAFFVRAHTMAGGRRAVIHQFPGADLPVTEDLGAQAREFELDAYVVGDDYFADRDALAAAVFEQNGPGTLVHPYLGSLVVQALPGCSVQESREAGGMAVFRLRFVEAGDLPARSGADTAQGVLNKYAGVIKWLKFAYATAVQVQNHPGFVLAALTTGLGNLAGAMLGLPAGTVASVRYAISQIQANPTSASATSAAIVAAMEATIAAVLAGATLANDVTGGFVGLAGWSGIADAATATTSDLKQQTTNATTLRRLVQGAATAAIGTIYAQTDFPSSADALAARDRLLGFVATQADAAAAAADDASYSAWLDFQAAVAADLAKRALSVPTRASYSIPGRLPSLALAQRLYADAAGADALADLNRAMHPMFMPINGVWLVAS